MPLKPTNPSDAWPSSPAATPHPFPASPTLEDLGDPQWIAAYEAAGGHVRREHSASGSMQATLVGPMVQPLSKPTPNFLRRITQPPTAASTAEGETLPRNTLNSSPPRSSEETSSLSEDRVYAGMRARAAAWLRIFSPATQVGMEGAEAAILRAEPESGAHAATSMRRALQAIADCVEPPGDGKRPDHTGAMREVSVGHYKNRLHIYLGSRFGGKARQLTLIELDLTEQRLRALIAGLGKAVHAECSEGDLEQLYVTCWSLIGRIASCAEAPA